MPDFNEHKQASDRWYSPPFLTHPGGYQLYIAVAANGWGRGAGTHVGITAYLTKGDNDEKLEWPFRGSLTVQLLNTRGDHNHNQHTISFTNAIPDEYTQRVTEGERTRSGVGESFFLPHTSLSLNPSTNTQYLDNNRLLFRVSHATVYSSALINKTPHWCVRSTPTTFISQLHHDRVYQT